MKRRASAMCDTDQERIRQYDRTVPSNQSVLPEFVMTHDDTTDDRRTEKTTILDGIDIDTDDYHTLDQADDAPWRETTETDQ